MRTLTGMLAVPALGAEQPARFCHEQGVEFAVVSREAAAAGV